MNLKKNIFNRKKLNYLLEKVTHTTILDYQEKQEKINEWINYIKSGNIYSTKETALQGNFLDDVFSNILGYKNRIKNTDQWNLNQEQLTSIDTKFADGSLGFFTKDTEDVRVVIELKDANTNLDEKQHRHNDTRTPIEQAFSYQHKIGSKCKWIIVSNYKEIRLYHNSSSTEFEVFILTELGNWEQFRKFYYLLSFENLISKSGESLIDSLYTSNEADEFNISKKFYSDFKQLRINLFEHLKQNNSEISEIILLEKTQKFLDRFIFISFCEDNRLLPEKTFKNIIEMGKKSFSFSDTKIWNELKGLFHAINIGSPPHNINKFNGGLFSKDNELDSLIINDNILEEIAKLTEYDFETDVDVNILGHIFEQSISDIEEIKAGIEGKDFDKKSSKRKKDGIYYTPEYITKYIVENAVGGWLEDRKKELGFYELPEINNYDIKAIKRIKGKYQLNEKLQKHLEFWLAYKEQLMAIKILDPACGSGAFLNQAFNFLYSEGQIVNDKITELSGGQSELFGLDKHILSNNLFGVDLNEESVEITKLSLWIKTANKYSELTALDNNIKCGNSLIDDPAVAGDKAFNWFREFPSIFPGYRVYSKKKEPYKYEHLTIDEIRERKLNEPEIQYVIEPEKSSNIGIKEPSYSYGPESKGFEKHGFDVIIGNPPYGAELIDFNDYLVKQYKLKKFDSYQLFAIKAMELLRSNGYLGFIIPNSWMTHKYGEEFRKIFHKISFKKVVNFFFQVFAEANIDTMIFILKNEQIVGNQIEVCNKNNKEEINLIDKLHSIIQKDWFEIDKFSCSLSSEDYRLLLKIKKSSSNIDSNYFVIGGYKPYQVGYGKSIYGEHTQIIKDIENRVYHSEIKVDSSYYPDIKGSNKNRYYIEKNKMWVKWGYWLMSPKNIDYFINPKIIVREIAGRYLIASYDDQKYFTNDTTHIILPKSVNMDLKFLLTIITSKLIGWYFKYYYGEENDLFPKVKINEIKELPIKIISIEAQKPFIVHADIMLEKNKELQEIMNEFLTFIKNKFGIEKLTTKLQNWYELEFNEFLKELTKAKVNLPLEEQLSWQALFSKQKALAQELIIKIAETDKKIDAMVYELYGLTEEEIKTVEGN